MTPAPDDFEGWFRLGVAQLAGSDARGALTSFDRALALRPADPDALNKRGNAYRALDRTPEALADYEHALAQDPAHPGARFNLATLLVQLARPAEALGAFDRLLAQAPDDAEAWSERGNALLALEEPAEALSSYDRALALQPRLPAALYHRGIALRALQRPLEALASFDAALGEDAALTDAQIHRGIVLLELKRLPEALVTFDRVLERDPDNASVLGNRALALRELERPGDALRTVERALSLRQDDALTHLVHGLALGDLQRHQEALEAYDRALALSPNHAIAANNRANVLRELGRPDEAIAAYDVALAADPSNAEVNFNQGICRLLTGDFPRGWRQYESRWRSAGIVEGLHAYPKPLWLGEVPLAHRTILLHSEQGLGDALQFCRYAPLAAAQGAKVYLQVRDPLMPVLDRLPGVHLIREGDPLPEFELHCPLLSLPLAFGTTLENVPAEVPYIAANPARVAKWRERLAPPRGLRVGLVWSGNPSHKNDRNRSIPLVAWRTLLQLPADFVSLQKDVRPADQSVLAELPNVRQLGSELADFADTAALISLLDLVISVDTSVAHLAGAMGKATWVLLPFTPDFRWMMGRTDSPWYPTVRLFRQPAAGDWQSVTGRVAASLTSLLG